MYSLNAICKATGKQWRAGGHGRLKLDIDAAKFLMHLILQLNNTAVPSGSVETLTSDHGGEVLSSELSRWLRLMGYFI